jgi:hypothetical protein
MASESNASSSPNGAERFRADALLPATVDFESLRRYASAKLSIVHQLRNFLDLLKKRGDESRIQSCEGLMAKLAEDRFTIAVLGQFKRGKSSLLNAIIGRNLLPTGILPLTTVITVIRFGARERLVIHRKGRGAYISWEGKIVLGQSPTPTPEQPKQSPAQAKKKT